MFAALTTLLGSAAGGSILGFLSDVFAQRRQDKQDEAKRLHEERVLRTDAAQSYVDKVETSSSEGTIKEISRKFKFWGIEYEIHTYKVFRLSIPSPRNMAIAWSLLMLVTAYSFVMVLFAVFPSVALITLNPAAEPDRYDFLLFGWTKAANNTYILTTGGVSYLMAHPLVFILSLILTGTARQLVRK